MKLTTCTVTARISTFTNLFITSTILISLSAAVTNFSVSFVLGDETQASFFIGNILSNLPKAELPRAAKEKFRASLLDTRGLASKLLHLNDMGDLYTITPIDRDDKSGVCGPLYCCQSSICSLVFDAIFVSSASPTLMKISVTIDIVDINDNSPYFQTENFTIAIPEDASVDFHIPTAENAHSKLHSLPKAKDDDALINGISTYELKGDGVTSGHFQLTRPSATCYPCLIINRNSRFDYENPKHKQFDLTLTATDSGLDAKSSSITIHIIVLDLNDNSPIFINTINTVAVSENRSYIDPIFTFIATDADSGNNSKIYYTIGAPLYHSINFPTRKFTLNSKSGDLYISSPLDYEIFLERIIILLVIAHDAGKPSLSATFTLTVNVTDINDNFPELIIKQNNTIMENGKSNQLALQMIIQDSDDISQGKITCKLNNDLGHSIKLIAAPGEMILSILITEQLDYELFQFLYFGINCTDLAEPIHESKFVLSVKVANRNDNGPTFYSVDGKPTSLYELKVVENLSIKDAILQPNVSDMDSPNLLFQLSLDENYKAKPSDLEHSFTDHFMVKHETGEIYLKAELDYEKATYYEFYLIAFDVPDINDTVLSSKVLIRVIVLDINDNKPTLASPSVVVVNDGATVDNQIAQISFVDQDEDGNQRVFSKIINQTSFPSCNEDYLSHQCSGWLALKENGALITTKNIHRKNISMILLFILAVDDDKVHSLSDITTITVILRDSSKVSPYLIKPFPGSAVETHVTIFNKGGVYPDIFQNQNIKLESYLPDSPSSHEIIFKMNNSCNGSSIFEIDSKISAFRLASNEGLRAAIADRPPNVLFKVCISLMDKRKKNHVTYTYFYVNLHFNYQFFGQAFWPSDSAETPNVFDAYPGGIPATITENSLSNYSLNDVETRDIFAIAHRSGSRLSFSNIIMCLLIFSFCLAIGFALFAAILWARAKQASSASAGRTISQTRPSRVSIIRNDSCSDNVWKSRLSCPVSGNSADIHLNEISKKRQNASMTTEDPNPGDAYYADFTEMKYDCTKSSEDKFTITASAVNSRDCQLSESNFYSSQVLTDVKLSCADGSLPLVAYFDLIVSTPLNLAANNNIISRENVETLLVASKRTNFLDDKSVP